MTHKYPKPLVTALVPMLLVLSLGCSTQNSDTLDTAEQTPPPPPMDDSERAGTSAQEPPPAPAPGRSASTTRPQRNAIPEERPRYVAPQTRPRVAVTIPAGTALSVNLPETLSSETALPGDKVTASLANSLIVGDRVVFPAGSVVEGRVSDVKSAKKGFKDTGGALSLQFTSVTAPDGHSAAISAGFTKLATGSAGKKAGIIGGSAVGGALLGKVLGKDVKGGAVIGGAIGTAVAGSTKGREAIIQPDEEINLSLERSAETSLNP